MSLFFFGPVSKGKCTLVCVYSRWRMKKTNINMAYASNSLVGFDHDLCVHLEGCCSGAIGWLNCQQFAKCATCLFRPNPEIAAAQRFAIRALNSISRHLSREISKVASLFWVMMQQGFDISPLVDERPNSEERSISPTELLLFIPSAMISKASKSSRNKRGTLD